MTNESVFADAKTERRKNMGVKLEQRKEFEERQCVKSTI
jgi:hypothetical protein